VKEVLNKGDDYFVNSVKANADKNSKFAKIEEQLIKNVPDEMKAKPNWVMLRTKVDDTDGKVRKFLIDCHTGRFAKSDEPETWSTFDEARKYAAENGGATIAYALDGKDDICCIDVDNCFDENGNVTEAGKKILEYKDKTYCETSISGKGLHLFGKTNGYDVRVWSKDGDMEFYQDGHFISMTGTDVQTKELMNIDASPVKDIISEKFTPRLHSTRQGQGVEGLTRMADRDVIEKASKSKTGQAFNDLYAGKDLQNNHSNSDMRLMDMLAFWCNGDKEQMDRIFRSSGLYRPEKSDSYIECTIMKAIREVGRRYQSQSKPTAEPLTKKSGNAEGNSK
jgi:putative DNA primase/helicase